MSKNPLLNALAAAAYIVTVASFMFNAEHWVGPVDTIMAPIAMLSLLTLSVATMAFVFFYQPMLLFLDNKKKEAAQLFVRTLGAFAAVTVIIFAILISGIVPAPS